MSMYLHSIQYGLKKFQTSVLSMGLGPSRDVQNQSLIVTFIYFYSSYVPETRLAQNRMS